MALKPLKPSKQQRQQPIPARLEDVVYKRLV